MAFIWALIAALLAMWIYNKIFVEPAEKKQED